MVSFRKPDLMVVLSQDGLNKTRPQLEMLTKNDVLYIHPELLLGDTRARVVPLEFHHSAKKKDWAIMSIEQLLQIEQIFPVDALYDMFGKV